MEEKKVFYKQWWFWIGVVVVCIALYILISKYIENKKIEKTFENMGKGASDFVGDIDTAKSHINEFNYNIQTGEVEYKPLKVTLEMYNKIKEEMTQEEVISILGNYDNKLDRKNTYILEWGNSYAPINNGYWIQIVFDMNEKVSSKYQMGLQ